MKTARLALALLLAACSGDVRAPSARVSLHAERDRETFDDAETRWETFTAPGEQALFRVQGGALEGAVVADRGYIWSLHSAYHQNIAVQAAVRQTQGAGGSGFGLMCRANAAGDGYYFVIAPAGRFAILKAAPGEAPAPLVDWREHPAIRPADETNTLSAICAGDYLAFSANGQFLADTRDDTFEAGAVGAVIGATGQTAWFTFDDLTIRDAVLLDPR